MGERYEWCVERKKKNDKRNAEERERKGKEGKRTVHDIAGCIENVGGPFLVDVCMYVRVCGFVRCGVEL